MIRRSGLIELFFLFSWLIFRMVSDWGRGLQAAGFGVDDWLLNLSYVGLAAWVVPATIAAAIVDKPQRFFGGDPIARAHLYLLILQFYGLFNSAERFGREGLLAAVYIWVVSFSFLLAYAFGVRVGQKSFLPTSENLASKSAAVISLCVMPTVLMALLQMATGSGNVILGVNRVFGGTSSPNILAALLLIYLVLLFTSGTGRLRLQLSLLIGLAAIAFVGAFSLSGFASLSFAGAIYFLLLMVHTGRIQIKPLWVIILVAAIAGAFYFVGNQLVERFSELQSDTNSLTWRTATWRDSLVYLEDWPMLIFGGGLGFDHLGLPEEPHNEWLRVILEIGLVGLAAYLLPLVRMLLAMRELLSLPFPAIRRRALGICAATAGLCLWATFDAVLRTAPSALLLWAAAGILIGNARALLIAQRQSHPAPNELPVPTGRQTPAFI
jgi:O-antigen ligase